MQKMQKVERIQREQQIVPPQKPPLSGLFTLLLLVLGFSLLGGPESARGADPVSQLVMPAGKLLYDHAFSELEASMDIPHPREEVLPRVHAHMISRDFVYLPDRSSENLLVFTKWEGLFRTTQYLVAFEVVDYPEGTRLGVTLSEPIQLFFIDPGILGRKPRSVRFLRPVLEEIGTIPISQDHISQDQEE